jgi:ribosomal protein S18 acetylase RimI-like enzyme
MDLPGGIDERLALLNQFLNPVEAIGQSMRAGERMMSPDVGGYDRLAALGDMLSGAAGVAGPAVVAGRAGVPAAAAVMEGLLGGSPTTQAAGDTMRAAGRDIVDRLNQPGPVPVMYSNPIPGVGRGSGLDVSRRDASNIFGAGSERVRYTDPRSGGTIEVVVRPDGSASVLELEVPEASRGQGIGQTLQERVMQDFPVMGGQVSSKAAATTAYRLGRRPPGKPDATLEEVFADIDDMSSVNMVSPRMQERLAPSAPALPTPRTDAEAMARDILQLRAEGRADEVTESMMLAADPQYMYMNTPLPMDSASRMARAEARGFAPTLHGTGSDISAVDEKFFGSGRDALGSGFYTTTNATRANVYAPKVKGPSIEASKEFADGANVMPLAVRMDRPFDLSEVTGRAADEIGSAAGQDPYFTYRSGESGAYIQGDEGQSAFLDSYHPRYQTLSRLREGFGPQLTSSLLSDAGYSGVVGPEASGNLVRVSFNPQDIRSRFARFDPAFAHLRNLSAALAAGVPIGLLAMQPDEEQY